MPGISNKSDSQGLNDYTQMKKVTNRKFSSWEQHERIQRNERIGLSIVIAIVILAVVAILLSGCSTNNRDKEICYLTTICGIDTIDSETCLYFTSGVYAICNNGDCDSTREFRPQDQLNGYLTNTTFTAPIGGSIGRIVKIKRIHTMNDLSQQQYINYDR